MRRLFHTLLVLLPFVFACTAPAVRAQSASPATEARLSEVEKKLDAALAEIERLKLGATAPESAQAYSSKHGFAPAASRVYTSTGGPSIGGYGEMLFESPDRTRQDGTLSGARARADLLRAVFYIGHKFSPQLLFNSEIEFEHAGVRDEGVVSVDPLTGDGEAELTGEATMEFAYLDWQAARAFGVRAGKVLVPMGLVNEQHEPPVFFGARRPDTERFIIPSTWSAAGAGFYGETAGGIEWRAYVVEGLDAAHFDAARAIREGRQGGSQALLTHPAFAGRFDWKGTPGALLGISGYTGDSWQGANPVAGPLHARVSLFDVHGRWQWNGLDLRGLYVAGTLGDAAALSDELGLTGSERLGKRFWGGYAEAAYDMAPRLSPGTAWMLAPYVRAEQLDTQDDVTGGSEELALQRTILTFGLAVKPHPNVVLKADREQRSDKSDRETSRWNVALGWLF